MVQSLPVHNNSHVSTDRALEAMDHEVRALRLEVTNLRQYLAQGAYHSSR